MSSLRDNDPVPGTSFPVRSALGRAFRLGLAAVLVGVIGVIMGPPAPAQACSMAEDGRAIRASELGSINSADGAWAERYREATGHGPPTIVGAVRLEVVSTIRETSTHHRGAVIAPVATWGEASVIPISIDPPDVKDGNDCRIEAGRLGVASYVLIGDNGKDDPFVIDVLTEGQDIEPFLTQRFGSPTAIDKPHLPTVLDQPVVADNPQGVTWSPVLIAMGGAVVGGTAVWMVARRRRLR